MSNDDVFSKYGELKALVESLEYDAAKNASGTLAAGVRLRKGLRAAKTLAGVLVKLTVDRDKAARAE